MMDTVTSDVSNTNRQTLATLYAAFSRGDVETVMAALHDDIKWRVNGISPIAGVCCGKDAVLAFFSRMMALYEGTLRVNVLTLHADQRYGLVHVAERAERPGDGTAYTGVHVWEFRERRCSRFQSYYDDTYADFWSRRGT